jgi:hypothetical protein
MNGESLFTLQIDGSEIGGDRNQTPANGKDTDDEEC